MTGITACNPCCLLTRPTGAASGTIGGRYDLLVLFPFITGHLSLGPQMLLNLRRGRSTVIIVMGYSPKKNLIGAFSEVSP